MSEHDDPILSDDPVSPERGPRGDVGQQGQRGIDGNTGARGTQGAPGVAADEQRVAFVESRGQANVHRLTFLFSFVVLGCGYFGYTLHQQDVSIRQHAYDSCQARNASSAKTNQAFMHLSEIDSRLLTGPKSTLVQRQLAAERTKAYAQAQVTPEQCGKKP